ncbi:hypothetical protein C799_03003 [Bacteroides thetaiotaomicron dnLKV9]|uniref:Uncharacterized protein n=2 Tax=Bacteroides thetaiotaomicron TaxID=818 RepID=R9HB95_BACT4|nr:hypothetical protein C799_03003 [Bacteroides thetaiotaomicron dnLKV9]
MCGFRKSVSLTDEEWAKINSVRLRNEYLKKIKEYIITEKVRAKQIVDGLGNEFTFEAFSGLFKNKTGIKKRIFRCMIITRKGSIHSKGTDKYPQPAISSHL